MEYLVAPILLVLAFIVFKIHDANRSFYVYTYTLDSDQIPTYFKCNLRTGVKKIVSLEQYKKNKPNNLKQEFAFYEWTINQ